MEHRIVFTIYPAKEGYPPINITCKAPEELCLMLRNTVVGSVGIGIEQAGGKEIEKTPLLDFNTKQKGA